MGCGFLKAEGTISFGTDWPAAGYFATFKPLDAIQVAVTRQLIGNADAPILEPVEQRLSVEQAVYANTRWVRPINFGWKMRLVPFRKASSQI